LLNYLRCSDIEIGLLLNSDLSPQFRRLAFSNTRKRSLRVAKLSEFLRNLRMTDSGEIRNESAAGF